MCSVMNCNKYDQIDNSDKNITMIATTVFDDLVGRVKASNLNFTIQMSPFSAYISLKKSFIRDKAGAFVLPTPADTVNFGKEAEYDTLKSDNFKLQKEVKSLKSMNQTLMDELACSKAMIKDLKSIQGNTVKCLAGRLKPRKNFVITMNFKLTHVLQHQIMKRQSCSL